MIKKVGPESASAILAAHAPHFGQAEAFALVNRLAFAQLHLADAVRPAWIAAIAHVLDEEGAGSRDRQQDLARPLVRDMRWAHNQRGTGPPIRQHMDCAQRHVGFARSALGHDPRSLCLAQILRGAGNGERLSWQRLAQKHPKGWCNGVFRTLERGIGFENPRANSKRRR